MEAGGRKTDTKWEASSGGRGSSLQPPKRDEVASSTRRTEIGSVVAQLG